ncbi:hypothetical protein F5Y11DRAFT_361061 [Daldinia sp. FL1419]|nr:hypothetical protein F5Y11DRAFT_361061 [Daldinia sp. FL1419]
MLSSKILSYAVSLVHTFEGANATTGISETSPDTFVVVAALIQGAATPLDRINQPAVARRIVHILEVGLMNGIVSMPGNESVVLATDSRLGVIFRVGDGYVYWSNSDLFSIYRSRIDEKGYPVRSGEVDKVATVEGVSFVDDFTFDRHGNIWVATNLNSTVVTIGKDGRQSVAMGSLTELTVAGDTSLAFGKTPIDRDTVYVTTSGSGKIVAVDTRGYY